MSSNLSTSWAAPSCHRTKPGRYPLSTISSCAPSSASRYSRSIPWSLLLGGVKRESGENPELPRSGKQVRKPTMTLEPTLWEVRQVGLNLQSPKTCQGNILLAPPRGGEVAAYLRPSRGLGPLFLAHPSEAQEIHPWPPSHRILLRLPRPLPLPALSPATLRTFRSSAATATLPPSIPAAFQLPLPRPSSRSKGVGRRRPAAFTKPSRR